jgi:hypothetical protein
MGITEEATERQPRAPVAHTPGSYAWACAQGWHLATTGGRGELVYAWKMEQGTRLRTATLPCGAGDDLGAHYGPACAAIARGEYEDQS